MKILLVTYSFYPLTNARSLRWTSLAKKWASENHHIDIVTAKLIPRKYINAKNINIYEVGRSRGSTSTLNNITTSYSSIKNIITHINKILLNFIKFIYNYTWKKLYWPDSSCLWYIPGIKKVSALLNENTYDVLITVSHPFTCHLIGLNIKKRHKNLYWLVDIGDPFSFLKASPPNNFKIYKYLNLSIENKVLSLANIISVTTQPTSNLYQNIFSIDKSKIIVIPPLISLDKEIPINEPNNHLNKGIYKIVYIGTLYKMLRRPDFLLNIHTQLSSLHKGTFELHFYGNIHDCVTCFLPFQHLINKTIFIHNTITREHIPSILGTADLLVNIGNETSYQLPSKVVEYAFAKKPILNLIKVEDDSSKLFFKDYPLALTINESTSLQHSHIIKIFNHLIAPPKVDSLLYKKWLLEFQLPQISAKYLKLLDTKQN